MAKKQDAETVAEKAPETVLVRALMPLWAGWQLVAPGTVYEQPAEAAAGMAALGMVEIVQREASAPPVSMTEGEVD